MGTTSLIVEMVIIGFQVLVWMVLIVLIVFGYDWVDFQKLKDWATILSVILIGASYTLGIVFDSFMASLYAPWERRSWKWLPEEIKEGMARGEKVSPGHMRAYLMTASPEASEELNNRANRNSLIRATSLNLVIICLASLIFVHKQFGFSPKLEIVIIIFSALLIPLSIRTWGRLRNGYYLFLVNVYQNTKEAEERSISRFSS